MKNVRFFRLKSITDAVERLVEGDDPRLLTVGQSRIRPPPSFTRPLPSSFAA
jgi:hypothetical protein